MIEYTRPWMYPKQAESMFNPCRYSFIEASTKSGKTVSAMAWLTEQAIKGKDGQNFWWIAPVSSQAKIAFRRIKRGLPKNLYSANGSEQTITLANGAILWFKTADNPDNLYGEDVYAAVIDEASRCKEDAWFGIRSTLTATNGPVRVIGNVKGRKNWFYKLARLAEQGTENFSYHQITVHDAIDAGVITQEEMEDAKKVLPPAVFQELYEAIPSEDEGNPFGITAIRACITPLSSGAPVVWGWDTARSIDWTVGIGLDYEGNVCRFERFQAPWEETFNKIKDLTGSIPAYIDATGTGSNLAERLVRASGNMFKPFIFTGPSKQNLMEGLAIAIGQKKVGFPPGPIVDELECFEYVIRTVNGRYTGVSYSAPEGLHDDCVCSLALAVYEHHKYAGNPLTAYGIVACHNCAHKFVRNKQTGLDRPCPKCGAPPEIIAESASEAITV